MSTDTTCGRSSRIERIALPHRAAMVSRYGSKAAHLPVYSGPAVRRTLERRGADGAALDGAVFLPAATVAPDLVAHEVVHALQQPSTSDDGQALLPRLESAAADPAGSVAENEAGLLAQSESEPTGSAPVHTLPAGVVALRRSRGAPPAGGPPAPAPQEPAPAAPEQSPALAGQAPAPDGTVVADPPAAAEPAPAPPFAPAPVPDTALDPAEAAAREAAKAEAEAALAAADSPSAVMDAYAQMAPSVKALHAADLGSRVAEANESSTSTMAAGTPEVSVHLSGEQDDLPSPAPVVVPRAEASAPPTDPAAPPIEVPAGPEQPALAPDPGYGPMIERVFGAGASPDAVADQLDDVPTRNPGIRTQVSDRADVPLEGANDPVRMDDETHARRAEAELGQQSAVEAVILGPGPEMLVPRQMDHVVPVEAPTPETAPLAPPPGAAQLDEMTLPPEVVARFDEDTGPAMAVSAEAARAQLSSAETDRDAAHEESVRTAETDRAAAEGRADAAQRDTIISNRESIQAERQRTVDRQQAEVERVEGEAETARAEHRAEADQRVETDRARIGSRYDEAERDSQAEVTRGEDRAEDERRRADRESEQESWWDRATSFIRRAFEALTSAINEIFDAVRAAVAGIIDAAVSAVTAIIEAAAAALQALVSALGELLKTLVDGLLGQVFPELAAELTGYIDQAVATVNQAIDRVAETLVDAVEAVGATLNAAIEALLDAYQNAINGALAVLEAAMTGDWDGLLLKVLDAILRLLRIDPAAFHAMIAQASDAVGTIINDPGRFLQNLLDAVVGGVRQFADNFGAHLRDGIIGWLTGALGGIQLPARWDVWGVLDLARQVLSLTWDFVRERATRIVGEQNVARLEAAFTWIETLVTEGWSGLWNRIMGGLESLKDTVLEAIRGFVLERVVLAAVRWLASLFSPVGAVVQLVMTIWNVYQFVANQLQRLFGIAQAVVQGMADIAQGVLGPAKQRVEQVLGDLLPVVIDLLMSLLGVTGVATRVREIIGDVRAAIARAVDNLLDRVLGALGLRRGASGAQARDGQERAADSQLVPPVRVDVAEGEDHTLSIDRAGEGGATVMLRTTPLPLDTWLTRLSEQASRMTDRDKKARVEDNIARAREVLRPLDDAADRAAQVAPRERPTAGADATAQLTPLEQRLVPVLQAIFNDVGTSELLSLYTSDIEGLPAAMRPTIRREIIDNPTRYVRLSGWAAVVEEMQRHLPLFRQPLAAGNQATEALRTMVETARSEYVEEADVADTEAQVTREDLLRFMASAVVADGSQPSYAELHRELVRVILGSSPAPPADALRAAVRTALTAVAARRASEVDPELRAAIRGSTVIAALTTIANGGTVGNGIDEARLEQLWHSQANVDHVKDAFRAAMPGRHEWIPSNYILRVLQRSFTPGRANEEAAEQGALWVRVQHEWRTRTQFLIFKPDYSSRTVGTGKVLQGHAGAIYARTSGERITQQTEKQNLWHDDLRAIFDASSTATGEAPAVISRVMDAVGSFIGFTVWEGVTSPMLEAFSHYFTSTHEPEEFREIVGRGRRSAAQIEVDFNRARGVIGA